MWQEIAKWYRSWMLQEFITLVSVQTLSLDTARASTGWITLSRSILRVRRRSAVCSSGEFKLCTNVSYASPVFSFYFDILYTYLCRFDEHVSFASILRATVCLRADPKCLFLATNPDPSYPVSTTFNGRRLEIPGAGAIARAVATAAGREPVFLGKPHAPMFEHLKNLYLSDTGEPLDPARTLFIGDRYLSCTFLSRI